MNGIDKNLAEIFDTDYSVSEDTENKTIQSYEPSTEVNQVETDANYVRSNLYGLIEKGNETIEEISNIAKESMHPRAFEVLGQMMKTQSDNLDKLLKLQKDKKELQNKQTGVTQSSGSLNIDKAVVFTGSTTDLLKRLRANTN